MFTISDVDKWFGPLSKGGLPADELKSKARQCGMMLDSRERLSSIKNRMYSIATLQRVPDWDSNVNPLFAIVVLERFLPEKTTNEEVIRQVKLLLALCNVVQGSANKEKFARHVFR